MTHDDYVLTLWEAVMLVTQRKGNSKLRYEVEDLFDTSADIISIRKVMFRMMFYEGMIPADIGRRFNMPRQKVGYMMNSAEDIKEVQLKHKLELEIEAIQERNTKMLM